MNRLENGATVIDSFRGEYRFLSNFWPAEVEFEGRVYASVEHAYQAAKCVDRHEKEAIRAAATPGQAKRMARKIAIRPDWESVKVGVMRTLVRAKFLTHADLAAQLLATGTAELVEGNTWNDTFWGVCRGQGQNWLGRLLMEVREELEAREANEAGSPTEAGPLPVPSAIPEAKEPGMQGTTAAPTTSA